MVIPTYEATPRLLPEVLAPAVSWMAWRLVDLPLASAGDLAGVTGLSRVEVNRRLQLLREAGLTECAELSWYRRRSPRWWLTDRCLALMEWPVGWSWQDEGGRAQLLQRLAVVEGLYSLAGLDYGLGPFREFRWVYGHGFEAAARYQGGWVALWWSGIMETRSRFSDRIMAFGENLQKLRGTELSPVPAAFGVAVGDSWQRELVNLVLHEWGVLRNSVVWSAADGSVSGLANLALMAEGGGWLAVPEYQREMGGWSWAKRVGESFCAQDWGAVGALALDRAWEWPGMGSTLALGGGDLHYGRGVLRQMVEARFLDRFKAVGPRDSEYGLAKRGVEAVRRRDGVSRGKGRGRFELAQVKERRERIWEHEKGIMGFVGQLARSGLTVHVGIRAWENIVGGKALSPDAVVWFERSPFGPGWHYVEYERAAKQPSQVAGKLRGYLAEGRRNRYPVLFIVGTARIEELFQDAARDGKLDLATTNFKRLKESKGTGGPIWSYYGKMVELG